LFPRRVNPTTPPSTSSKATPAVRPAPKLAPLPTGKLARHCQNIGDPPSTPTLSKAVSVPRRHGQLPTRESCPLNLSRSVPLRSVPLRSVPLRSVPSLSSIQLGKVVRKVFPICNDLTDAEDDVMLNMLHVKLMFGHRALNKAPFPPLPDYQETFSSRLTPEAKSGDASTEYYDAISGRQPVCACARPCSMSLRRLISHPCPRTNLAMTMAPMSIESSEVPTRKCEDGSTS
jgi:hypothetical protein